MSAPIQPIFGKAVHADRKLSSSHYWTAEEDAMLCDAIADGLSFRHAAQIIKTRSRDACIGRFHRLLSGY